MRSFNGSLYVNRKLELKDGVHKVGDKIVLGERTWDGIDRPDYTGLLVMTADEARYIGQELLKLAEQVDGKGKKDRTHAKVRKNTLAIAAKAKADADL